MATEDEVRAASQTFYVALNRMLNGEASALGDIWSHGATVTTMHPIGGREMGWDKVRETWEQVAKQASAGNVQLNDQHIQASGDMACEVGTEKGQFTLGGQPVPPSSIASPMSIAASPARGRSSITTRTCHRG